jgi:hypothetical protein
MIKKLLASLDNTNNGYSARKLTAFVLVSLVVLAHVKWLNLGDLTQLGEVLIIDYTFISALFGMTTYQKIKSNEPK